MRVAHKDLKRHEQLIRAEGIKGYHIWPKYDIPVHYVLSYYEPQIDANARVVGLDIGEEPTRINTMAVSAASGQPAVSPKVWLFRDQAAGRGKTPGFIMYAPVYRSDLPIDTVKERERALIGFVTSAFRASTLFEAIFKQDPLPEKMQFA